MVKPETVTDLPAPFLLALASARGAKTRNDVTVTEIPPPAGIAPASFALSADVRPTIRHGSESLLGTGRFILLYDASKPESWGGNIRVVAYAQAPFENDIGIDPFVAEVTWSWLLDALETHNARYTAPSGTATKTLSTGFGELIGQGNTAQLELRASWTPIGTNIGAHVQAWGELLCLISGLPPLVDGVSVLPR